MIELQNDPAMLKLIDYAKNKSSISYDEVNDFLPDSVVNSEKIEEFIGILAKHNVTLEEEDVSAVEEEEETTEDAGADGDGEAEPEPEPEAKHEKTKKKLMMGEKDSAVDDPI